ncbi:MAG: glycosyltransferase family 2 protein [Opitutales bacterium]
MNPPDTLPLISIGIPTYNRPDGLLRAVKSVRRQTCPRLEILISDNASTDTTQEVCQRLAESDNRIRYVRQPKNLGPLLNFEFLLEQSAGTFFMWVADDDTLEPNVLERYVDFLESHPDHVMVAGVVRHFFSDQANPFMEEKGFTFTQEHPVKRISAFYRKVSAGAIFHGLMRRKIAAGIGLKKLMGADWIFISAMLMKGKIKQFDFPGYNKSLMGFSQNFEHYAATVGASHFARRHPYLALSWHASAQFLVDRQAYGSLSDFQRVRLFLLTFGSLTRMFTCHLIKAGPGNFLRSITRSAIKTLLPGSLLRWLHKWRTGAVPEPATDKGEERPGTL